MNCSPYVDRPQSVIPIISNHYNTSKYNKQLLPYKNNNTAATAARNNTAAAASRNHIKPPLYSQTLNNKNISASSLATKTSTIQAISKNNAAATSGGTAKLKDVNSTAVSSAKNNYLVGESNKSNKNNANTYSKTRGLPSKQGAKDLNKASNSDDQTNGSLHNSKLTSKTPCLTTTLCSANSTKDISQYSKQQRTQRMMKSKPEHHIDDNIVSEEWCPINGVRTISKPASRQGTSTIV